LPNKKDFGEMTDEDFNSWKNKLLSTEPEKQRSFILDKINEIYKSLPKTLLKNKKIIDNE
jgi:hypothetical protein